MALSGTEVLQVQAISANGSPAATTETVTVAQIAALAGAEMPVVTGLSANSGGVQAGATALTIGAFNNITTVGGSGYSVIIPTGAVGQTLVVSNQGANAAQIFGTGTATINGVAYATGISIPVGAIFVFTMAVLGNWLQNVQTGGAFSGTFDGVLGGNTPAAASVTTLSTSGLATCATLTSTGAAILSTTTSVGLVGGGAGTLNIYPTTTAKGKLVLSAINNTGNFASTITNKDIGQATVYSLPDCGAATTDLVTVVGTQSVTGVKTFTTPVLGAATATSINGLALTTSTGTLTVPNGVTVTGPATTGTVALINPPPQAGGASLPVTAAMSGKTILLDTAAGTVATLPAATGTGNKYKFFCTTTTTSGAHKILAVGSDYLIGNINGTTSTALTAFHALVGAVYQSLQMPFAGSQPSGGIQGDWFEFEDVAAAKWAVKGQFTSGTSPTTPFNTATS